MAPELLSLQRHQHQHQQHSTAGNEPSSLSFASDLWSLGCVMFECCAGHPPFHSSSLTALIASLLSDEPAPALPPPCSPSLANLVARLLAKDPRRRITWQELREHAFWKEKGRGAVLSCRPLPATAPAPRSVPYSISAAAAGAVEERERQGDEGAEGGANARRNASVKEKEEEDEEEMETQTATSTLQEGTRRGNRAGADDDGGDGDGAGHVKTVRMHEILPREGDGGAGGANSRLRNAREDDAVQEEGTNEQAAGHASVGAYALRLSRIAKKNWQRDSWKEEDEKRVGGRRAKALAGKRVGDDVGDRGRGGHSNGDDDDGDVRQQVSPMARVHAQEGEQEREYGNGDVKEQDEGIGGEEDEEEEGDMELASHDVELDFGRREVDSLRGAGTGAGAGAGAEEGAGPHTGTGRLTSPELNDNCTTEGKGVEPSDSEEMQRGQECSEEGTRCQANDGHHADGGKVEAGGKSDVVWQEQEQEEEQEQVREQGWKVRRPSWSKPGKEAKTEWKENPRVEQHSRADLSSGSGVVRASRRRAGRRSGGLKELSMSAAQNRSSEERMREAKGKGWTDAAVECEGKVGPVLLRAPESLAKNVSADVSVSASLTASGASQVSGSGPVGLSSADIELDLSSGAAVPAIPPAAAAAADAVEEPLTATAPACGSESERGVGSASRGSVPEGELELVPPGLGAQGLVMAAITDDDGCAAASEDNRGDLDPSMTGKKDEGPHWADSSGNSNGMQEEGDWEEAEGEMDDAALPSSSPWSLPPPCIDSEVLSAIEAALWHEGLDDCVRPIMQNRRIERIPAPTFDRKLLPVTPLTGAQLVAMAAGGAPGVAGTGSVPAGARGGAVGGASSSPCGAYGAWDQYVSRLVSVLSGPAAVTEKANVLRYLQWLASSDEGAATLLLDCGGGGGGGGTGDMQAAGTGSGSAPSSSPSPRAGVPPSPPSLLPALVRCLRAGRVPTLRCEAAAAVGLMLRNAQGGLAQAGAAQALASALCECVREREMGQEKLRRRAVAALGELVFFCATQNPLALAQPMPLSQEKEKQHLQSNAHTHTGGGDDSHSGRGTSNGTGSGSGGDGGSGGGCLWYVPAAVLSTLLSVVRRGEDEVGVHYAVKAAENLCSLGEAWVDRIVAAAPDTLLLLAQLAQPNTGASTRAAAVTAGSSSIGSHAHAPASPTVGAARSKGISGAAATAPATASPRSPAVGVPAGWGISPRSGEQLRATACNCLVRILRHRLGLAGAVLQHLGGTPGLLAAFTHALAASTPNDSPAIVAKATAAAGMAPSSSGGGGGGSSSSSFTTEHMAVLNLMNLMLLAASHGILKLTASDFRALLLVKQPRAKAQQQRHVQEAGADAWEHAQASEPGSPLRQPQAEPRPHPHPHPRSHSVLAATALPASSSGLSSLSSSPLLLSLAGMWEASVDVVRGKALLCAALLLCLAPRLALPALCSLRLTAVMERTRKDTRTAAAAAAAAVAGAPSLPSSSSTGPQPQPQPQPQSQSPGRPLSLDSFLADCLAAMQASVAGAAASLMAQVVDDVSNLVANATTNHENGRSDGRASERGGVIGSPTVARHCAELSGVLLQLLSSPVLRSQVLSSQLLHKTGNCLALVAACPEARDLKVGEHEGWGVRAEGCLSGA